MPPPTAEVIEHCVVTKRENANTVSCRCVPVTTRIDSKTGHTVIVCKKMPLTSDPYYFDPDHPHRLRTMRAVFPVVHDSLTERHMAHRRGSPALQSELGRAYRAGPKAFIHQKHRSYPQSFT